MIIFVRIFEYSIKKTMILFTCIYSKKSSNMNFHHCLKVIVIVTNLNGNNLLNCTVYPLSTIYAPHIIHFQQPGLRLEGDRRCLLRHLNTRATSLALIGIFGEFRLAAEIPTISLFLFESLTK